MLRVRNLSKAFGAVLANNAISLDVATGSIVALIGPNGSGKSTLFNCITGDQPCDAGDVEFAGSPLRGLGVAEIARLGLIRTFQQAHVFEGLTCLQNMAISASHAGKGHGAMLRGFPPALLDRALELLEFAGLDAKAAARARELSYGERKLLEFAMALMNAPKLLLLDEPTSGVNTVLVEHLIERLRRANASLGIALLIIEHNMRVVMALAERIYCLAHGKVLACGTPSEIRADARVRAAYLGPQ